VNLDVADCDVMEDNKLNEIGQSATDQLNQCNIRLKDEIMGQ